MAPPNPTRRLSTGIMPGGEPFAPAPAVNKGGSRRLQPGDLLGERYKIEAVLGAGGMGVVYRAVDQKLEQMIALKVLRSGSASLDDLRREIVLARRVTHENVCRIYDLEELDGYECVSMEYIDGESLFDLRYRMGSSFPVGRGLDIAKQICRGLSAAHRMGVVHRDLKPENVLIDREGHARIMDFGIASAADIGTPEAPGTIVGTPQFMPPERLRGEQVDVRGDVYSLGVIFFEMFTGQLPFDADDISALAAKVAFDPPPSPRTINPEVPEELAGVILRCLSKRPAERYQSVGELLRDIERGEGLLVDQILTEMSLAKARTVRLLSILEANKTLTSALDIDRVLGLILDVATKEVGADRGTIFLVDAEREELLSRVLAGGEVKEIRIPITTGIAGAVATSGDRLVLDDAYQDNRFNKNVDRETGYRTRNLIAVPMRNPRGTIVGVLELLNKHDGGFSDADAEFLEDVSVHAAIALENARRHSADLTRVRTEARSEAACALFGALRGLAAAHDGLSTAGDGATGGGCPGVFAARRRTDGSIPFLVATDGAADPLDGGIRLLKLVEGFLATTAAATFELAAMRQVYAELAVPFGAGGPRALGGCVASDGTLHFDPAGQPAPIVLRPRGAALEIERPTVSGGTRLASGDVVFFADEDLLTLRSSDDQPLGLDAILRFFETHRPTSPQAAVDQVIRLASMFATSDATKVRWFAAALAR